MKPKFPGTTKSPEIFCPKKPYPMKRKDFKRAFNQNMKAHGELISVDKEILTHLVMIAANLKNINEQDIKVLDQLAKKGYNQALTL
jgi:hypothetical protein